MTTAELDGVRPGVVTLFDRRTGSTHQFLATSDRRSLAFIVVELVQQETTREGRRSAPDARCMRDAVRATRNLRPAAEEVPAHPGADPQASCRHASPSR
jgi:hypothetical protein